MNLRKLMALFMAFSMMFSLGLVVEADESVEIISPANGAVIEYSEDETELVVSVSEGMKLQIYLDGKRLDDAVGTGEETKVMLGDLELGKHEVSVVAIMGSEAYKQETTFTVAQSMTKEDYYDTFTGGSAVSIAPYSSRPNLGVDENGENIPAYYGSFAGVDGDSNGSIGFRFMETATAITMDEGAEICYVMEPLPYDLSYKFSLEYDLMLLNPGAWEIRGGVPQSGGNKYSSIAVSRFLGENGFVAGTSTEYPIGEWMHIKHEVNVAEGITSVYIDDALVLDNINVGTANLTGLNVLKFQYYATQPEGPQGFNLDNVSIKSEALYGGIFAEKYVLEDGTEKSISDDGVITEPTKKIIFKNDVMGFTPWDKKTKLSLFANGEELSIASVRETSGNNFSVELLDPLPEKAHIEVFSEYNALPIKAFFDTNVVTFGIYDVTFRKGSTSIYSTSQLSGGESLNCFLSVKTNLTEDKDVLAIVGVYSGNRLVSLQPKDVKINGNTTVIRQKIIPVNIPENIDDISIEVFFIDALSTRKPLSYPFVLGK